MNLRKRLEEALIEAAVIDTADGTVPYWRYDLPTCPPGWGKPDRLLDALERAVKEWDRVREPEPNGRHRKDDSSIWLG